VHGGGELTRLGGPLARQPAFEDPCGGPRVDGVGSDLDLEHAVGDVLAYARLPEAGVAGGALERLELASAFVDGDDAGLGVELGFDVRVLVLAGDLPYPAAGVVADDQTTSSASWPPASANTES
jgi:hypothetical protein